MKRSRQRSNGPTRLRVEAAVLTVATMTSLALFAGPAFAARTEERLVFTRGCDAGPDHLPVWFLDPAEGTDPTPSHLVSSLEPTVSPDGKVLALSTWEGLWTGDASGSPAELEWDGSGFPEYPVWSPTSDRIAFVGAWEGTRHVMIVDLNSGQADPLLAVEAGVTSTGLDWSPDGRRLLWSWEGRIGTVEVDDGSVTALGSGSEARYSSDGSRIAFSADGMVGTMASDGGDVQMTNVAGTSPIWSPDGETLAFQGRRQVGDYLASYIGVYSLDGGGVSVLYEGDPTCDDVLYLSDWAKMEWPTFDDALFGHVFYADIEWLAVEGITRGCNPPANDLFCADQGVTRGEMAAFLTRALGLTARLDDPFADDNRSVFESDIEKLAAAGITRGCNPPANTMFCPDAAVTRGQMAAFLARALDLGGESWKGFADDDGSVFEADIAMLASAGIARGCNPPANTMFCPEAMVTRGQMAAFIHRAMD